MELIKIQEVSLGNYIPHPVCVSGLALTSLRTEKFGKVPLSVTEITWSNMNQLLI